MTQNRRLVTRVNFESKVAAYIVAADGSWQRKCFVNDISKTGAKLTVDGPLDKLNPKQFFLVMSANGNVYRRCEKSWIIGSELGVNFIEALAPSPKRAMRQMIQQPHSELVEV